MDVAARDLGGKVITCQCAPNAALELSVALISGSAALLADMIHHLDTLPLYPSGSRSRSTNGSQMIDLRTAMVE